MISKYLKKKKLRREISLIFGLKKNQPVVCRVPLRPNNEQNMMSEKRVKSPESDQSIQEI